MRPFHSLCAGLCLLLSTSLSAQIYFEMGLLSPGKWGVFALPDEQIFPTMNTITGSGQVTIVLPAGQGMTNFANHAGMWSADVLVASPMEDPASTFISVGLLFDNGIGYQNGGELLFSFNLTEQMPGSPRLICNDEPFAQVPNSVGSNPGNEISVLDFGDINLPTYYYIGNLSGCTVQTATLLTGTVLDDLEGDCIETGDELTLAWRKVKISNSFGSQTIFANAGGTYFRVIYPGEYTIEALPPTEFWHPCQAVQVSIPEFQTTQVDLGMYAPVKCPQLSVSLNTMGIRPCLPVTYRVQYENLGTALAESAYLYLQLNEFLSVVSAGLPFVELPNHRYEFFLGEVPIGFQGSFEVVASVSCEILLWQYVCASAEMTPNEPCTLPGDAWSGAEVFVDGWCEGSEVKFSIQNTGDAAMPTPSNYRIIKDGVEIESADFQLFAGEALPFFLPADGATYRLEADQTSDYPATTQPSKTVEGCANGGSFTTGIAEQFPTPNYGISYDEVCREAINSYDPNDKQGFPIGYGAEHFIERNTDIEYLIRFQNTGTATALEVKILDTLSQVLNVNSLRPGPSSHPYQLSILDDMVLEFYFEDIMLPDSNANEAASHGFVSFSISQEPDLPAGALIENSAAIYFDNNAPVITNTAFHTIGEDYVEALGAQVVLQPGLTLFAYPNPMGETVTFDLGNAVFSSGSLEVYDLTGAPRQALAFDVPVFQMQRQGLPSGFYTFKVDLDGIPAVNGKLTIKAP